MRVVQVSHEVTVAQPLDVVWQSLGDVDSMLAALPGAALARTGAEVSGSLKCKLGATQVTYRVAARAEVGDAGFHTAVVTVDGEEARGTGTLHATLTVALRSAAPDTRIEITGDVAATGRGESATAHVWERMISLLVNAAVPSPAPAPAAPTTPPPRVPLSIAPPLTPPASSGPTIPPWAIGVGVLAVVVIIARRRCRA